MSAGQSSSRGKGLRPHQPLCVPSGGTGTLQALPAAPWGTLPGWDVDLGGQHSEQRWACLSHTWGDRCDRVKGVTSPGRSQGSRKHTLSTGDGVASRKLLCKGQVWVWTVRAGESSHCGRSSAIRPPLTSPAGTRTQGPCLSPSSPGRLD